MKVFNLSILITLPLLVFAPARVGSGAVSLWTFDEGQGNTARDSASGISGTVHGAGWVEGQVGSGLSFDGLDDYVELPRNEPVWLPQNDFSVAFWVYFEREAGSSVDDNEVLVDLNHGASSTPSRELGCNIFRRGDTDKIGFQMTTQADSDEDLYSHLSPVPGQWYHVVAVREGTEQRLYIDGRLENRRRCSATPVDFVGGYDDDKVNIGRFTTNTGQPRYHFKGQLDELAIMDRALSAAEVRLLHREPETPNSWYVEARHGDDLNDGQRLLTAVATIQKAIELAQDGDTVNVCPGTYREEIDFLGKAITVQSAGDAAILEAPDGFAVSFLRDEGPDSVLRNVVITNACVGIFIFGASPTIANITVTGNEFGIEAYRDADPAISNSLFWDNAEGDVYGCGTFYCCVQKGIPSRDSGFLPGWGDAIPNWTWRQGRIGESPLFADAENGDYHLRSERGRYWPEHDVWVLDDVTSPCIDAGDPAADFSRERLPNGGRLNIGAYGGTAFAGMSESPFRTDFNGDRAVDANDLELFTDVWEQEVEATTSRQR